MTPKKKQKPFKLCAQCGVKPRKGHGSLCSSCHWQKYKPTKVEPLPTMDPVLLAFMHGPASTPVQLPALPGWPMPGRSDAANAD